MLYYNSNIIYKLYTTLIKKTRKDSSMSHVRLAFCSATKILLAFISRAAGSTVTTSRKSAIEEKMIWKITLCSALIFFCKRYLHD